MTDASKKKSNSATKETKAMDSAYKALVGLERDEQERVLAWLYQILKLSASTEAGGTGGATGSSRGTGGRLGNGTALTGTPGSAAHARAFMVQKKPANFQERVACLAYYLTHYMNTPTFKTLHISETNSLAGQPKLSNAAKFVSNAVNQAQYLSSAGKAQQQITARGEALVEALPNREDVDKALSEHPLVGRSRKGKSKSGKEKQK